MELSSNALVTWEFVRDMLGYQEAHKDKVVQLINWISARGAAIAGRGLVLAERTALISGTGSPRLYLPVVPVRSVASVTIDPLHLFTNEPQDPSEYHVAGESGIITRYLLRWPEGLLNIQVVYSAGWTTADMPDDVRKACLEAVQTAWNRANDNSYGVTTRTTPDGVNVGYEQRLSPDVYGTFADLRLAVL